MKFVPMSGEASKSRSFVGKFWNPKYLRAIPCILNVTRTGVVMDRTAFFEKAFGRTIEEYIEILRLPETYILYRKHFEDNGILEIWHNQFENLTTPQKEEALKIIYSNDFANINNLSSKAVFEFMKHYTVKYKPIKK